MIDLRRADERFHTEIDWLDSWHCFSFSNHYDQKNTHHGLLMVLNDDVIAAGGGFGTHGHRDMEIVTWVLDGALEHRDSEGNQGVITPGVAQRMSAGTGIRHSEQNASRAESVRLLQMWVPPDTMDIAPGYEQHDISSLKRDDELFPLASGREAEAAIQLHQRDATLWVATLNAGARVVVPDAPFVHVMVSTGGATFDRTGALDAGDALRCTEAGTFDLVAIADGTEVTIWEMWADLEVA
ncbi:MAG TPA: pirin family protein [Acidimicrobiia bacterium]|jgi:redox-sensitive bicupin YhaK (pirin superfamily)|nr:pirin family protein [Acidimicrobiia bacterium]